MRMRGRPQPASTNRSARPGTRATTLAGRGWARTAPGSQVSRWSRRWGLCRRRPGRDRCFSKDFAHYIAHLWTPEYISNFRHSFLIRDPAKVLPSFRSKMGRFEEGEVGFAELRELFDRVVDHTGEIPPVVDSDDLLVNPVGIVRRLLPGRGNRVHRGCPQLGARRAQRGAVVRHRGRLARQPHGIDGAPPPAADLGRHLRRAGLDP